MKDLLDLTGFFVGNLFDFAFFPHALAFVVFGIAAGGEVSTQPHRDGSGGDLGQSGDDDEAAVVDCSRRCRQPEAKGTVSPSDMPMTTSRTTSPAVKWRSMCGVCGMFSELGMGFQVVECALRDLAFTFVA